VRAAALVGSTIHYRKLSWELVPAPQVVAENVLVPVGTPVVRWDRIPAPRDPLVFWARYFRSDSGCRSPERTLGVGAGT
jgi:DNA-binding GntR family transcriptional regulator